ncbi:hypothetical protein CASFOL_000152 [Castilleja foliolosa]|uniref:Replication factor A C-terminal domain-containing protein n=1 Tax=Castilleja foliolosa TaxID=1961234 RepID=A0ABD3ENJ4_9LAMI
MTFQRVRDIKERQKPGTIEVRVIKKWISKGKKEELCYQFIDTLIRLRIPSKVRSQETESTSNCASQEDANEQLKHTRNPWKQQITKSASLGDCIEATADVKHVKYFDSIIQLQSCYTVSGYIATGPRTYMATVDHPASLVIGRKSRFDPATDQSIPSAYFIFATYDMLSGRIKDPRLLTDYIGRVQTSSLRTTSTQKTLRKTLLQDELKKQVEITLWSEKIHLIDDKVKPGDIDAVTSTMVTEHNGRLQLESTYLTTTFINPDMPQTIDYINRPNAVPAIEPTGTNEPTTTLADLKLGSNHTVQNPKNFKCEAKIIHIHENRGWYYVLCSKCSNKLYPEQHNNELNYVCKDDDNITPNFRYCVNATIEDTTGCADTVFFNESIQSILNISCEDMVTKHAETRDPKIVPQLLKSIANTTRLLHLTLKTDGQIVVNNVSDVRSQTEKQTRSSTIGTSTFTPSTPVPKPATSKRPPTETPGSDKSMRHI